MTNNFEREHDSFTNKEFQRELIADNFQLLAAIGWCSYLSDGKGFIFAPYGNGSHVWCGRLYPFLKSYQTTLELFGISSIITMSFCVFRAIIYPLSLLIQDYQIF